ncbi:hypothetical protein TNCV_1479351 [Trichonephila clavipes]|nr:hypothetical protein TNCV_1479351 [Trichonephila clavipes]
MNESEAGLNCPDDIIAPYPMCYSLFLISTFHQIKVLDMIGIRLRRLLPGSGDKNFRRPVVTSVGLSIGRLGQAPMVPDKLDFTRFSGNKLRSTNAKGAYRSSTPRARNELKPALVVTADECLSECIERCD